MARYYRRRYRSIAKTPKKKWCSIMKPVSISALNGEDLPGGIAEGVTLAENEDES